jgi:hypothetical protein
MPQRRLLFRTLLARSCDLLLLLPLLLLVLLVVHIAARLQLECSVAAVMLLLLPVW